MRNLWQLRLKSLCINAPEFYKVTGTTTYIIDIWNSHKRFKHSIMDDSLKPPPLVRGMKILDKEKFKKTVTVPCLYLPSKSIQSAANHLKKYILKLQNFKPISVLSQSLLDKLNKDAILLEEKSKMAIMDPRKVKTFSDIALNDRLALEKLGISEICLFSTDICLNYDNWKADEILRAVIPAEFDAVSGYSLVGHVVHLNLRECLTEYKGLIGAVLLEKVKSARSVVNKVDTIDNKYRNFKMELLCGDDNMVTQVQENKCWFKFDFSKVYWNPRLSTEHERITNALNEGDIFYDIFAGVGPFSVPAAKKGCITLANDLNPDSIKWLETNITLNKIHNKIKVFNKDGNEFIKEDIKHHLLTLGPGKYSIHIAMNLPAYATTFLPSFRNLFSEIEMEQIKLLPTPKVYIYMFTKGLENSSDIALKAVEDAIDQKLDSEVLDVFFVRDVAPNKKMMRVTLLLTENILNGGKRKNINERQGKKICI